MKNEQTPTALTSLLNEIMMQESTIKEILFYLEKHVHQISKFANEAYLGDDFDYKIIHHHPFQRLVIICYKLLSYQKNFTTHGIPRQIMIDTFKDVTLRQELYLKNHKKMGLTKDDVIWFRHLEHFQLFKIDQIQFQMFHMIYLDSENFDQDYFVFSPQQKQDLPNGTPVINVHLQNGAELTHQGIINSFDSARVFFETYFPEYQPKAFLCYSWLLHPNNQLFLTEKSNILAFARQFKIISTNQDNFDAIQGIYGKRYQEHCKYPQNTSLQRLAVDHLSKLGDACGIKEWEY